MTSRAALTAAGALAIAAAGVGAGAGLYAAIGPSTTTTVVSPRVDNSQPVSASGGLSVNAIYQRTYQGVVDITVTTSGSSFGFGQFGGGSSEAEGSGFVYDKNGDIVTNQHVVAGANSIKVHFWNGQTVTGKLVGSDGSTDLAVVHVNAPSSMIHPLTLGDSSNVKVGDSVIAIGSPFGLPQTVTSGIVSALHRTMDAPNNYTIANSIQTDAPINHGNSGGPLINSNGDVIGVNSQIQSESGGSNGVGFAIPSNTVGSVASQIVAHKTVAHAYLGITVEAPAAAQGAGIAQVLPNTPASRARLKVGDVIVKLGGTTITSPDDLSSVIDGSKPGDKLVVTYVRDAKRHAVTIKLGTRPS